MYVGTSNAVSGGQLYKTTDGTSWTKITVSSLTKPANQELLAIATINNRVYIGTYNNVQGGEFWSSSNGLSWTKDATNGFGHSTNDAVLATTIYQSYLYIGTYKPAGGEIWRKKITPLGVSKTKLSGKHKKTNSISIPKISGTSPYTYTKTSGTLPAGMTLSATTGKITGKPKKKGKYTFTLQITDSGTPTQTFTSIMTLTIFNASIKINNNALTTYSNKVTLSLSASDGKKKHIKYMRFSNNGKKWSKWKKYHRTYSNWVITKIKYGGRGFLGSKKVYAQFKNKSGVISPKYYDKIRYQR